MLTGYTDRLSVAPGDAIAVMAAADAEETCIDVVEVVGGEGGRGVEALELREVASLEGRTFTTDPVAPVGSYAQSLASLGADPGELELHVDVFPTRPAARRGQALLSLGAPENRGLGLALTPAGRVVAWLADDGRRWRLELERPLRADTWQRLALRVEASGEVRLTARALDPLWDSGEAGACAPPPALPSLREATIALAATVGGAGPRRCFDGKLARPRLTWRTPGEERTVTWDLGNQERWDAVPVAGENAHLDLRLVNGPTRAVTGPDWNGDATDWRLRQDHYDAIHFHSDDLVDAGWPESARWTVPSHRRSGLYAFRLLAGSEVDLVPFVVRPAQGRSTDVVVLLPTMTYLAYANERLGRDMIPRVPGWEPPQDPLDDLVARHPQWGKSLYDEHDDGSGVSLSSLRRPIPNMRPHYRTWFVDGPRHLAADVSLLGWLRAHGVEPDVVTDHDLDRDGEALLRDRRVVVTGSHPEYVSGPMLDALEAHIARGGRLMYLGGNGFYWVTSLAGDSGELIEVRRGTSGTRAWESAPGEERHASTGELGGLWRHRGRPPNRLVGVGFASQGWDGRNRPYRRTARGRDPDVAWVFEGVDGDLVGERGLVMDAAAGDELDRADAAHGTPPETIVLASAEDFSDAYQLVIEDALEMLPGSGGSAEPRVRADMTLTPHPSGGATFAVGSISWSAALPIDGGDNPASRVTENVLRRFLRSGSPLA